jgi:predicted RNase H-like HicB family nuclease
MGMLRFYPALLWWRGPLQWHTQVLDFKDLGATGRTRQEALDAAQLALQERVNALSDQELPHPSHRLVVEAKLVSTEAHGMELIEVLTRLESDVDLGSAPEKEEKSNDSNHKGNKKKRRPRR